jgi:precorrin-2 dehydrogenase/sirohydrochlorin ferrochelatase
VLVVGGGEVAAGRIYHLLNADANITVISPTMNPEIEHREQCGLLHAVHRRPFVEKDLFMYANDIIKPELNVFSDEEYAAMDKYLAKTRFELVLVAIDDPVESKKIYYQCKAQNLNVNIADVPPLCDFYFGSIFRKGQLQVMVSTNGKGPRMARLIKDRIRDMFDDYEIDKTVENIGQVRRLLRIKCGGNTEQDIKLRMDWMTSVTDMYSFRQWSEITDGSKLIEAFPEMPPKFDELEI